MKPKLQTMKKSIIRYLAICVAGRTGMPDDKCEKFVVDILSNDLSTINFEPTPYSLSLMESAVDDMVDFFESLE